MTTPLWCACGNVITFSNEDRCEDCYADGQKNVGKSMRVKTPYLSDKQVADGERRAAEIRSLFKIGGGHVKSHHSDQRSESTSAR